jgi:hypothetical protein
MSTTTGALQERDIFGAPFSVGDYVMVRCLVSSIVTSPVGGNGGAADLVNLTVDTPGNTGEKQNVTLTVSPVQCRKAGTGAGTTSGGAPTFSYVSPDSGPTAGGTAITIFGSGFTAGTTVYIGGQACTSVVVVSSGEITAVTPAGTQGLTDIKIMTSGGSVDTLNAFLYANGGSVTMTITAAQLKALNTTPISVVTGIPGAVPVVESGFIIYNPGTSDYTVGPDDAFELCVGPVPPGVPLINYTGISATDFIDGGSGFDPDLAIAFWNPSYQSQTAALSTVPNIPDSGLVGSGIYLFQYNTAEAWPSGTNWTDGNGTMTLFVEYIFVKG